MPDASPDTILDAAERLFAERGFKAATIQLLARESGLSTALIYYYYQSKRGLYDAVFARFFRTLGERASAQAFAGKDPAKNVRALLGVQGELILQRPHAARLLARELAEQGGAHAAEAARTRLKQVFAGLTAQITEGQRRGVFRRELDPVFAALSCVSQIAWFALASPVISVLLDHGVKGVPQAQRAAFVRHAADFALAALQAPRPRQRRAS